MQATADGRVFTPGELVKELADLVSVLRSAQGVLAVTIADDLAFASSRQMQVARERIGWIAVALWPAGLITRIMSIHPRLFRVAGPATEAPGAVVAVGTACLSQLQIVIAIEIVVRIASGPALLAE